MIFKTWDRKKIEKNHLRFDEPQKKQSVLEGIDPRLKQVALDRLAILRKLQERLSKPRRPKSKGEVIRRFLEEYNSGILFPRSDWAIATILHLSRATIYNWQERYKKYKLTGLVPKYKMKGSPGKAVFRPLGEPVELKFLGPPRRNGKKFFLERLKRRWKHPPLGCPIRVSIFYDMPVSRGITMPMRRRMLRGEIVHIGKPTLDDFNVFYMNCLIGVLFKDRSQIIKFNSEKKFSWYPQTRILIS